jgi:hypothetical protein
LTTSPPHALLAAAMIRVDIASLSRRNLLALGAALSLPIGCAAPVLPSIREVNLDALTDEYALLLGRIRMTVLTFDRTGDTFVRTTAGGAEVLLPPEGVIAWVVHRPPQREVRLLSASWSEGTATLGARGPIMAPYTLRTPINYFGTIELAHGHALGDNRASRHLRRLDIEVTDDHRREMPAFVAQNPRLAGRQYCHVPRMTVLEAPRASG